MSFSRQQSHPAVGFRSLPQRCQSPGCDGYVTRHSLGCAQSIYRCSRCFQRYDTAAPPAPESGRLRKFVAEFVSWREEAS